ncbi:MAG: DUF2147 domain-containing protein [Hyphomicrobium sp.]
MSSVVSSALAAAAMFIAAFPAEAAAAGGKSPLGIWLNDTGAGAVEITECAGGVCGRVVWVKEPSKRQQVCGLQVIGNAAPVGGGVYDKGWIYDPKNDMTFDVELTPLGDSLQVMGYLGGDKTLSRTMTWTPAPADLDRC